ncbi:SpoIID/LytB domain-containing protein [Candidatus Peregrinibacteria bacterium]|nr:SpoIID/LytB domain-containing protein [Candidatus Peregrinibacteria bacterium]
MHRKFKILLIAIFATTLALTLSFGTPETKVYTISSQEVLTLSSRPTVYNSAHIAPYKTVEIFLSEEYSPGFKFTSVGGSWDETKPNGTSAEGFVRFKIAGNWGQWVELEEEEDLIIIGKKYAMASSNPATHMQYKFEFYGDGIARPIVKNPQWTFIKTGETRQLSAAPSPEFAASGGASTLNIISRYSWGADESYRYLEANNIDPVLIEIDPEYYEKFKDELKYSRVVETDSEGDKYKWPLQYPEKVKKFIIHHTATTGNLDDPKQAIRDIYYYHAVTRAWGDIGYNYIIDQQGKIYEGRFGGEGVIGAHSGPGNNSSIGIAILGNYEDAEVPEKVIAAVSNLIGEKSKLHAIDPASKSTFRGEDMHNVFGHKDIMATTCPGINLYEKLPVIRIIAAQWEKKKKEKFVKDDDFQDVSDLYYLELKPDEEKTVTLKMENIGKKNWDGKTFIVVDTNPEFEGMLSFPGSDPVILAKMQEKEVKPGKTATFTFNIKAGKKSNLVYMHIAPVFSGAKKAKDYLVLPVSVQQVDYKYQFVDAKYPEKGMEKGEKFTAWVKLKNTGNITWRKGGENTIYLKADHDQERISQFSLPRSTKMGFLTEEDVKPGEIGTFTLDLKAPGTTGHYREYFTPYIDGVGWLKDYGMYFETTVFGGLYEAEVIEKSGSTSWRRGGKYAIRIKLRNLGKETWTAKNMKLMILKESDLKVTDAKLINEKVESGDIGTISFVAEVSSDEKLEKKSILIRPTVNKNQLLKKPIYYYYRVTVNEENLKDQLLNKGKTPKTKDKSENQPSTEEGNIRVKLSFSGEPQITGNGEFEVYQSDKLISTLKKDKIYTVEDTETKTTRFMPKSGTILRIENFEHHPAWNPDLNDNEYRGTLEVQKVGGNLVVINELPLESYLKGLGEVSNNEKTEKIKAIMVAARSYAKYYMTRDEKFPGKPYHLDDDPENSQKYLGYGLEKRSPNVKSAVEDTKGEVIGYEGKIVKAPYFNQSDGTKTKSAKEVWGWDNTPYLVSVDDSFCDGDEFLGHGVGMSGCGAKGLAEQGYLYKAILKHYYTGIEILDLY